MHIISYKVSTQACTNTRVFMSVEPGAYFKQVIRKSFRKCGLRLRPAGYGTIPHKNARRASSSTPQSTSLRKTKNWHCGNYMRQ